MKKTKTNRIAWRFAIGLLPLLLVGCSDYGTVSPAAYEYAKAIYSISNRQAIESLDQVSTQIATAREAGELSDSEADWLNGMIANARDGEWKVANVAARRMMEDQVQ